MVEVEPAAFTIEELCVRNKISCPTYHKWKRAGKGPREMVIGNVIRISVRAERDWQAAREKPDAIDKANAARRRAKALKGGKAGAASPRHVANRKRTARND